MIAQHHRPIAAEPAPTRRLGRLAAAGFTAAAVTALILGPAGAGVAAAQVTPAGPTDTGSASSGATAASAAQTAPGPGLTAASTFSKSGTDATNGSNADSSSGLTGTTSPGDTINWVLHYHNSTGSVASADISDAIGGDQSFVPGSLKAPPAFTPQWSTDGGSSFVTTEPGSGVNAVGATGREATATGAVSDFPPRRPGFRVVGVGDGWEALFFGANIYNVHHHANTSPAFPSSPLLECHVVATGASCAGFPANGGVFVSTTAGTPFATTPTGTTATPTTPQTASSVLDPSTGRLFTPVGLLGTPDFGLLCMDLTTNTSCGFIGQGTAPWAQSALTTAQVATSGATSIGTKIYTTDFDAVVHCYDYAANADCGSVKALPGYTNAGGQSNAWNTRTVAFGTRIFSAYLQTDVSGSAKRHLLCVDTATMTVCPGFPVRNISQAGTPPAGISTSWFNAATVPVLNASGAVTGVCVATFGTASGNQFACVDTAGASIPNPYPTFNGIVGNSSLGDGVTIGTKVYLPVQTDVGSTSQYSCTDFAVSPAAPCAGFNNAAKASVRPYTLRVDPSQPNCIYEVGDAGTVDTFSALTGGSCMETVGAVNPAAYYCDGLAGHTSGWNSIDIGGVTSSNYTSARYTVFDKNGAPVSGFDGVSIPSTTRTIDISSIPMSGNTAELSVRLTLEGLVAGVTPTLGLTFDGDPVQVCFQTKVSDACPTAGATVSNTATVVTTGVDGTTDAPGGNSSGAATFTNTTSAACGVTGSKVLASVNGTPYVGQQVNPGDVLVFQIVLTNSGAASESTTLTETVGTGLSYTGTGEGWTSGCTTEGTTCTQDVTLAGGGSQTVDFTETVDNPLPAGTTDLTNSVTSSNGTLTPGTVTVPVTAVGLIGSWSAAAGLVLLLGAVARWFRRRTRLGSRLMTG